MPATQEIRDSGRWLEDLSASGARAEAAQRDLRRVLQNGLRRSLRPRGIDDESIEDFVQEAMVKVLGSLDTFRGDSQLTTWAMAIAIRTAFSELRRARWRDRSLDEMLGGGESAAMARLFSGPAEAEASILRQQIRVAMEDAFRRHLTDRQRKVLLAELAEVPKSVIAERLGTNTNALYKLSHDARKRLRAGMLESGLSEEEIRAAFQR